MADGDSGKISYFGAVLMSINIMVGAGILYAVGPMTAAAGSVGFLVWPLVGLLLFPVVWSIAKAAAIFPGDAGFYGYCSKGLSPLAGFIAQWGFFLGYMGTASSLATVLREGIIKNSGSEFLQHYPVVFNLGLVAFYTAINLIPVSKLSKIQSIGTLLKLTPIALAILLLAFFFNFNQSFDVSGLTQVGVTISTALFAFWGFETCCSIGGLLKNGPQKVASVILVGFLTTVTLYLLFHLGLLYIMGADNLAAYGAIEFPRFLGLSPAVVAATQVAISFAVLFSWANSILGASLGNITNLNTLAQKKLLLGHEVLTAENRYQRPHFATFVYGILLFCFITFIQDVDVLFALTSLGISSTLILTVIAVFRTQWQRKNYFQVFVSGLALVSCGVVCYYCISKIPDIWVAMPLIGGMILGVVMYKLQSIKNQKMDPALALEV